MFKLVEVVAGVADFETENGAVAKAFVELVNNTANAVKVIE